MAVSHNKTLAGANWTGTVTVHDSRGSTVTVAATGMARPVDWNSAHNFFQTISGNTAGVSTASGTNLVIAGSNNITAALSTAAGAATLWVSGPDLTQYLTTAQSPGAYLTTARASNDAVGLNTAATNVTWTVNSSGISLNAGAYLTTAQPPGAYLTTARASNDAVGLNTALTGNGVAWTVNSSGLSLNVPAFLTTAAQSNHSHGNPTLALTNLSGTTASNSAGLTLSISADPPGAGGGAAISASGGSQNTGTVVFSNSNGISFGYNAATITASAQQSALAATNLTISTGTGTQSTAATIIGPVFSNSNNVSFGLNAGTITASASFSGGAGGAAVGISTDGNTAGTSGTFNSGTYVFEGSNSITVSQITGAGSVHTLRIVPPPVTQLVAGNNITLSSTGSTISIIGGGTGAAGAFISAGTNGQNSGTVSFANSNGVSFGMNTAGVITASAVGGAGGPSAIVAGTQTLTSGSVVLSGSGGITVSGNGQTAIISFDGHHLDALLPSGNGYGTGFSSMTSGTVGLNAVGALSMSQNGNNLSLSVPAQTVQPAVGLNTAATQVTWTVNSSGISLNAGAYLTTAQPPGAYLTTARASNDAIGLNTALTANGLSVTANSSGLSINVPSWLTTAAQSNHSHNFATTTTNGASIVVLTTNSAGATIGVPPYLTTAQPVGAYLTTARASNDAVGLNTALTANGVSWTVNSSGLSLNVPAFLTTAAQSNHSHTFSWYATGNSTQTSSGSYTNSIVVSGAGIASVGMTGNTMIVSVPSGGGAGDGYNIIQGSGNTAGTMNTYASATFVLAGGSNITLSQSSNTMTINAPPQSNLTYAGAVSLSSNGSTITISGIPPVPTLALTNLSGTTTTATNGAFTLSLSAAAPGGGAAYTALSFQNRVFALSSTVSAGQNSLWVCPVRVVAPVSGSSLAHIYSFSGTITSAATAQAGATMRYGLYSQHSTDLNRFDSWWSSSNVFTFWNSGTSSYSYSYNVTSGSSAGSNLGTASVMGLRLITCAIGSAIPAGLYLYASLISTSSAGYSAAMSRMVPLLDNAYGNMGFMGSATNASVGLADAGTWTSATTGALPASISIGHIAPVSNLQPVFKFGAI